MSTAQIIDRLAALGCAVLVDGEKLKVRGPDLPEIPDLVSGLRRNRDAAIEILRNRRLDEYETAEANTDPVFNVDLALRIGAHLETLPEDRSVTASEIARAIFGRDGSLDRIMNIFQVAESLVSARVLIRGCDGFGYQLSAPFSDQRVRRPISET